MPALTELVSGFLELESSQDLFEAKCAGRPFWDYVRYPVFMEIANRMEVFPPLTWPHEQVSSIRFRRIIREGCHALKGWRGVGATDGAAARDCDVAIFDCDARRLVNGVRVNPVMYPVIRHLSKSRRIVVFDFSSLQDGVAGLYPCEVRSFRPEMIASNIRSLLYVFLKIEKELFRSIQTMIGSAFGVSIDVYGHVRRTFLPQRFLLDSLIKVLSRYAPKAALFLNDGRRCQADSAHALGIPAIELQNGAASRLDLLSSYGARLAGRLPTQPDFIFTFGPYWNDKFASPAEKKAVGFPYFERERRDLQSRRIQRQKKTLVGISVLDHGFARCLLDFARMRPDFTVYYKLRPEEYSCWQSLYSKEYREQKNFVFIENDRISLYEYLCSCEFAVSSASTAIYEALFLGARVVVYKGWFHETTEDLVDLGIAAGVSNAAELSRAIETERSPSNEIVAKFYMDKALDNIEEKLQGILCKKTASLL